MATIQTMPDYTLIGTIKELNKQIGLEGDKIIYAPGLYITDTDTMLVVPLERSAMYFWNRETKSSERFLVQVYNTTFDKTILSVICHMPARCDLR